MQENTQSTRIRFYFRVCELYLAEQTHTQRTHLMDFGGAREIYDGDKCYIIHFNDFPVPNNHDRIVMSIVRGAIIVFRVL